MKIEINEQSIEAITEIAGQHDDKPNNIRIYVAGMGCSGPSFGLALDEVKEEDLAYETSGVKFLMNKDLVDQFGDIKVEQTPRGFVVEPVNKQESACGSCSGSCS